MLAVNSSLALHASFLRLPSPLCNDPFLLTVHVELSCMKMAVLLGLASVWRVQVQCCL